VTDIPHWRNPRESLPEPLHPAAFVVDCDEQRRTPQRTNIGHQVGDLLHRLEIPGKQNHAAHGRLPQQVAVSGAQ
jgi:hypothetical protein